MDNKTIISTSNAPLPIGPYSQAVKVGQTLYISGQIALDPITNELLVTDVTKETNQVMRNIEAILEEAGYTFSDVVKCTIFINDMSNFATVNEVYGTFFTVNPPARETVEVSKLPKNVNVEISCIAFR